MKPNMMFRVFFGTVIIDIFLLIKCIILQSAGTDSTVNLWLASPSTSDEFTAERLFACLGCSFFKIIIII